MVNKNRKCIYGETAICELKKENRKISICSFGAIKSFFFMNNIESFLLHKNIQFIGYGCGLTIVTH